MMMERFRQTKHELLRVAALASLLAGIGPVWPQAILAAQPGVGPEPTPESTPEPTPEPAGFGEPSTPASRPASPSLPSGSEEAGKATLFLEKAKAAASVDSNPYSEIAEEGRERLLKEAGFGQIVAERLTNVIPLSREVERESGIDWKVFVCLLGMENSFSTSSPDRKGPYQITKVGGRSRNYPVGENTAEEFVAISVEAAVSIEAHAERIGVDINDLSKEAQGRFANDYNGGRIETMRGPDGRLYYGLRARDYKRSGFVVNNLDKNHRQMYVSDGDGGWVKMQRDGYLTILRKLKEFEKLEAKLMERNLENELRRLGEPEPR